MPNHPVRAINTIFIISLDRVIKGLKPQYGQPGSRDEHDPEYDVKPSRVILSDGIGHIPYHG